jgi:uncharacterized protein (TIGR03083 family)
MHALVAAWCDAIESFESTVSELPDEAFTQQSLLPGWTIGDIVAHVVALEVELGGEGLPGHEPDWDALPHADDLFSRYTEIGVDFRRGRSPAQLRTELADAARIRIEQLVEGPQDMDHMVTGPGGIERTLGRVLGMRTFDVFLHGLDVRDAAGMPPPVLGAAARATADQMASGLGYVWVKKAGAQSGDVLHFVVPEWIDAWIGVGQDGRGRSVESGEATTTVTVAPMNYLRLGSGRRGDPAEVDVQGRRDLGQAVVAGLNVAP